MIMILFLCFVTWTRVCYGYNIIRVNYQYGYQLRKGIELMAAKNGSKAQKDLLVCISTFNIVSRNSSSCLD